MKKLVNTRAFLFMAVGIVLGIISAYNVMYDKWAFFIVCLSLTVVASIVFALLKAKVWISFVTVCVCILLGFGVFNVKLDSQLRNEVIAQPVELTGRVTDIGRNGDKKNVLYLDDCTLSNGQKIKGRVRLTVYDGSSFDTGDNLEIMGVMHSTYVFAKDVNVNYIRNRVYYELVDTTVISQTESKLKVDEIIRKYVYERCEQFMPDYPDIMYALLTGDRNAMDTYVEEIYKNAGVLHLIAVSGMHLVYIITIMGFFMKRFKLHPLVELAILIAPLTFYCYVCSWAPSILRALIMMVCVYLARWLFGRYDLLTSLCWSVVVLLLIQPYYLFDVGWQLSVMAVYGIATLHFTVDRFLQRKKLNKFTYGLLTSVSLSLSCTISTLPTMAYYFGTVPILGVITNLLAVPLMSVVFTLGFVGMLPWVFGYVLYPANLLLVIITKIAELIANLNYAVVSMPALVFALAVGVVWLFIAGQYVNLKAKGKIIAHTVCGVAMILSIALCAIKQPCENQVYVAQSYGGLDVVVSTDGGKMTVITDLNSYNLDDTKKYLDKYNYDGCDLFLTKLAGVDHTATIWAIQNYNISKVYVLTHQGNDEIISLFTQYDIPVVYLPNNTSVGDDVVVRNVYDGSLRGVHVTTKQLNFSTAYGDGIPVEHYQTLVPNCDFYLIRDAVTSYNTQKLVTFSLYQAQCDSNYGANKYGNFTITQKDGTIIVNFK